MSRITNPLKWALLRFVMWPWSSTTRRERIHRQALSLTPVDGVSLEGFWTVMSDEEGGGPLASGARLMQHGVSVEGWLQGKFAAAHPLTIRGIVLGRRLIATWSRPHAVHRGSGVLQLTISDDRQSLEGAGTWFSEGGVEPTRATLRWTRSGTSLDVSSDLKSDRSWR
jgi:hypothetical protein